MLVLSHPVTLSYALAPGASPLEWTLSWHVHYGAFLFCRGTHLPALWRFKGFSMQNLQGRVKLGKFIRLLQSHTVEGQVQGHQRVTSPCQLASTLGFKGNRHNWHGRTFTVSSCSLRVVWTPGQLKQGSPALQGFLGWKYIFFSLLYLSLYRNDKRSGGLKFRNCARE